MAVRDPTTPPALRAELERYLANPFRAAAQDQDALLKKARAPFRSGRQSGEDRDDDKRRRAAVRALGNKHPTLASAKLFNHVDAKPIRDGGLKQRRFANILSEESPRRRRRTD